MYGPTWIANSSAPAAVRTARAERRRPVRGADAQTLDVIATTVCQDLVAQAGGVVLAVSGGPDSIALMHVIGPRLCGLVPLWVATVDHGLRPDARQDADFAVAEAQALGLTARVLTWDGPKPSSAIQEKARRARYALLTGFAHQNGATHLLTAHTLDDQAETILFRMARGSGIDGLSGMSGRVVRDGIVHMRPLLDVGKAGLVARCRAETWAYRTDPSNEDPRFARSRLRRLLPLLADEQLDAVRLAKLGARLARSETALQAGSEALWASTARQIDAGGLQFDARRLAAAPDELVIRVLGKAVGQVGGGRTVRLSRLEDLAAALRSAVEANLSLRRTLGGALLRCCAGGSLVVSREGPRRRGLDGAKATQVRSHSLQADQPRTSHVVGFPWQGGT